MTLAPALQVQVRISAPLRAPPSPFLWNWEGEYLRKNRVPAAQNAAGTLFLRLQRESGILALLR